MKVKKFLAILAMAGAVLFWQEAVSEAHSIATDKSVFTFTASNFSINSPNKFRCMQVLRYKCDRCGKLITFDGNPNAPDSGVSYGCPAKDADSGFFGDRHMWRWIQ